MQRIFSPELLPTRGGIIYAAVHEPSGFVYLGSTINPRLRLATHARGWMNKDRAYKCGRPLWNAIHSEKYQTGGVPVPPIFWLIEALEIDATKESAHAAEQRYLGILESYVADNGNSAIPRFSVFFDDGDVAPARVANTKFSATGGRGKGFRFTPAQLEAHRTRGILRFKDPAQREALRARAAEQYKNPVQREALLASHRTPERREAARARTVLRLEDPAQREAFLASQRTPERREAARASAVLLWQDPAQREAARARSVLRFKDPAQREAASAAAAPRAKPVESRPLGSSDDWTRYVSVNEAARHTGCFQTNISAACNGKHKSCGGREWRFSEPTP